VTPVTASPTQKFPSPLGPVGTAYHRDESIFHEPFPEPLEHPAAWPQAASPGAGLPGVFPEEEVGRFEASLRLLGFPGRFSEARRTCPRQTRLRRAALQRRTCPGVLTDKRRRGSGARAFTVPTRPSPSTNHRGREASSTRRVADGKAWWLMPRLAMLGRPATTFACPRSQSAGARRGHRVDRPRDVVQQEEAHEAAQQAVSTGAGDQQPRARPAEQTQPTKPCRRSVPWSRRGRGQCWRDPPAVLGQQPADVPRSHRKAPFTPCRRPRGGADRLLVGVGVVLRWSATRLMTGPWTAIDRPRRTYLTGLEVRNGGA
jgi:hypothetical protein